MTDWKRFEHTETEVLIDYFQDPKVEGSVSDDAFLALCFRFRGDLIKKCEIICRNKGHDIDVARQIAENTFKIYGKSKGFKISKGNKSSVDDCFKVYLYRIAGNELKDYYKREEKRKNGQLYDGTEEIITQLPEIDTGKLDLESKIIHETLLSLSDKHQVVYMTYEAHERDGVRLPRPLLKKLRNHLGVSQDRIRELKKEAKDKINATKEIIQKMNKIS